MIEIPIGSDHYQVPTTWSDITAYKATKLHKLCQTMPESLKAKYELIFKEKGEEKEVLEWYNDLEDKEALEVIPAFQLKVIQFLLDLDKDLTLDSINSLYYNMIEPFVVDILYNGCLYRPVKISHFTFNGNEYELPSDKKIGDVIVPMYDLKLIQFTESSDFLGLIGKEGYKFAPFILATLCLKKGEKWSEDLVLSRAKEFEELPMSTVWDVFFYLISSVHTLKKDSLISFHQAALKERKHQLVSATVGGGLSWTSTKTVTTCFSLN
jgi:hypothetical protein